MHATRQVNLSGVRAVSLKIRRDCPDALMLAHERNPCKVLRPTGVFFLDNRVRASNLEPAAMNLMICSACPAIPVY